jgi:CRISPR-associated protein Csy1
LADARGTASSHTNAKQLYWLVGVDAHDDGAYHLLAPLYPTSLVHRVYQQLQDDRFGADARAPRDARKSSTYHARPVREYPQLAIQRLGGTKPQNISQLNSERRGDNCLLASIPPIWKSEDVRPLLRVGSLFKVYGRRRAVAQQARALRVFLQGDPPRNEPTRRRVREWVQSLIDELVLFQAEFFTLAPGWSQADECLLSADQRTWLDPQGQTLGAIDQDDAADAVAADFARWVNEQLRDPLPVGDPEFLFWRKLAREQFVAYEREAA